MQQQQQEQQDAIARQEEYTAAQRSAVESVMVGRATAEAVQQQGEQLQRAENIADDTQYKLDKATRLLKGMTWSGWVGNMFTSEVQAPIPKSTKTNLDAYDGLPEPCQEAAQAIKNYHANVSVLEDCETEEQKETCVIICDDMFTRAENQLKALISNKQCEAYALQMKGDLDIIRKRQLASQTQVRGLVDRVTAAALPSTTGSSSSDAATDKQKEELFGRKPASSTTTTENKSPAKTVVKTVSPLQQQQDQHLEVISASLGELGTIADSLNTGLSHQQAVIEQLDTKSENVLETSKMVSRRADRLVQTKTWTPVKHVFECNVALRHLESGKYVGVTKSHELRLVNVFSEQCQFGLHKRQGRIFGLQSLANRKWVGQNLLGNLNVSATSFGRRQEWEADEDWKNTRLLCASAGWGQGGYLQVRPQDFGIAVGGSTVADAKTAARFCILKMDELSTM